MKTNYSKILFLLAFIAFSCVSCWATAESLNLLLPSWPNALCWIVTIGFYILAAYGTKWVVDSFNKREFISNRRLLLFGGILTVLVFWGIFSFPTNTHTFFYRNVAPTTINNDISTTKYYLNQLSSNQITEDIINAKISEFENAVKIKLDDFLGEVMNEANPGDGPKARAKRQALANLLDVPSIEALSYRGTSAQDRQRLCDSYRKIVYRHLETKKNKIRAEMTPSNTNYQKEAEIALNNLNVIEKGIVNGQLDIYDADDVNQIIDKINACYSVINNHKNYVIFKSNEDKARYTAEKPVTDTKQLLSVYDVWMDFLSGKYAGHGFAIWIVLSLLVDIAAFAFFDLALKK